MDECATRAHSVRWAHEHRQHLVLDRYQFRRIARLGFRRGNHDLDALTDIAHAIPRQGRMLGAEPWRPAHVLGHEPGIERAKPLGRPLLGGQDSENSGRPRRRFCIDRMDAGMGMRRIHEDRVCLAS